MASSTDFMNNTTADQMIVEVWAKEAIYAREKALVHANLVWRVFEKEVKAFGDLIHINTRTHLSTQSKTTRTAISYEALTDTNLDITINTWEYSAIAVETKTKKQSNRDLMEFYAPEQGYTLALSIDAVLAGLVDNFSQTVGTLAIPLTHTDLRRARQYLDDADAPAEGRVIIVSPAQESHFADLPQFVNDDYAKLAGSTNATAKDRAYVTSWMGIPIYKTTGVEGDNSAGHDNSMFQKEALALVVQMDATTHMFFDIDYLANKAVVEQLYGSKETRDDHGVWLKGA